MKFGWLRNSLVAKLSIFVSLPVLMTSMALSSSFIRHYLMQIETVMRDHGVSIARDISIDSEYGLLMHDKEVLNKIVEELSHESDLLYIAIQSPSGEILCSHGEVMEDIPADIIVDSFFSKGCQIIETEHALES